MTLTVPIPVPSVTGQEQRGSLAHKEAGSALHSSDWLLGMSVITIRWLLLLGRLREELGRVGELWGNPESLGCRWRSLLVKGPETSQEA